MRQTRFRQRLSGALPDLIRRSGPLSRPVLGLALKKLPFYSGETIWQQDGAPPHSVRPVTNYFNPKYNLWIRKNGPIHWPAKNSDLNPLDSFLWGTLKNNIYSEELSGDTVQLEQLIRQYWCISVYTNEAQDILQRLDETSSSNTRPTCVHCKYEPRIADLQPQRV
ncbi:hypothetical protein NQ318_014931 [Aromia moschata]|uniref:Transposase n=1 Tax=Aromia moschata TaxID=1265417 RepID=A0AAV8XLI1_9CUCU|nr:hypothetical protein NQ318_014931 [Aromia moschata]